MDLAEMSCLFHRDGYERQVPRPEDAIDGVWSRTAGRLAHVSACSIVESLCPA